MANASRQPSGCGKAFGCLGVPLSVLLVVLFLPPQLSRLMAGPLRPGQGMGLYGRANGWDELAALGARIRPAAGPGDDLLGLNAALVPEIDAAMARPALLSPSLDWYSSHGCDAAGTVRNALDLSSAAAARAAAEGRTPEAVERWFAQLRTARKMADNAASTVTVDLSFDREVAVCAAARQAMNQVRSPVLAADWQPLRDMLRTAPGTGKLVALRRSAQYHWVYAREFEPSALPASARPSGAAAWLDRLPPNCFDDPWHSLTGYRQALRRVCREAAKPRPERDWERLRRELEPQPGFNIYNLRGRWVPAEALQGLGEGFDGEDQIVAFRRLTDAMIALRIAYDRDGRLPAELQRLVTAGLLDEVPEDPFDAWPMKYDPKRRLLWSVGSDELDDGGKATPGTWRPDIVVALEFAE